MKVPKGTFAYSAVVPSPDEWARPWPLEIRDAGRGDPEPMCRGHAPSLEITEAGLTPNAGRKGGVWRPSVLRSRFRLSCHERSVCFHVDRSLTSSLGSGDVLHLARTAAGGLALSALRGGRLVVAVGAVTAVPLGAGIQARLAPELWDDAIDVLRPGPGVQNWDPKKEHRDEWPVELRIDRESDLFFRANQNVGRYHVFIERGFWRTAGQGLSGTDERVSLARLGECPPAGANASAQLLFADGLGTCD